MYILNAFSLNMIEAGANIQTAHVSLGDAKQLAAKGLLTSAIGHADTAVVVGNLLGVELSANRVSVSLSEGELVLVAQYRGPRLPEGATELPEGASIEFMAVMVGDQWDEARWDGCCIYGALGKALR